MDTCKQDRRKLNGPPPPAPRALSDECVWSVDEMIGMTMQRKEIARRLGVDLRTLRAAEHRRGAYKDVSKKELK